MRVRTGNVPERVVDVGPAYGAKPGSRGGVLAVYGIPPKTKALEGIGHTHGQRLAHIERERAKRRWNGALVP